MRSACASAAVAVAIALAAAACGGDGPAPLLPADYAATFVEVRDCRPSGDHDLRNIRVVADPAAAQRYLARDTDDVAAGALIVKEELDFGDTACAGPVLQWTVMQRSADADADPRLLGWTWQRIDPDRTVVSQDEPRCFGCHAECGVAPDGYLGTCAVP